MKDKEARESIYHIRNKINELSYEFGNKFGLIINHPIIIGHYDLINVNERFKEIELKFNVLLDALNMQLISVPEQNKSYQIKKKGK